MAGDSLYNIDALYRMDKRLADLQDTESALLKKIEAARVYTIRENLNKVTRVWELWRVFSPGWV